ncbi:MAG: hypothetical protein QOE06_1630 [Thermoleophilaceae bacterium]|nr:hypothetical protein [Thermoleophilaceae bacterium]
MRRALAAIAVVALAGALARRRDPDSPAHTALVHGSLTVAAVPFLASEAARRRDARLFWELLALQQLRAGVALAHHHLTATLYEHSTDVDEYHAAGQRIAESLRAGRLSEVAELMRTFPWDTRLRWPVSTNLMRLLNGGVYAAVGPSRRTSMVAYSWLGFCGLCFFERAFSIGVPHGRRRAYLAALAHPSLTFWTSGIGKEPWMTFGFGTLALGAAKTMTGSARTGLPLMGLGTAAAGAMRIQVGGRLGMTLGSELRTAGDRSYIGGSRFTPPRADSIRDAPRVAASVLFRPLPGEAHNRPALVAAADAMLLLLLTLARARWIAAAVASAPRRPYVAFAAASTAVVVAYLARVANFGMLVRQRTPVLPFYLVLLSVPPRGRRA